MWALRPAPYHDNDMPIDLRKNVVLQRELDEQRQSYRRSEDTYAPRDYSLKDYRERWQQQPPPPLLPVSNLYPFMSEKYGVSCSLVAAEDREKPQDLRPSIKGTLETAIKRLHTNKLKQVGENGKNDRCRSAEAVLEKSQSSAIKAARSNSCPDLTSIDLKPTQNLHSAYKTNGEHISEANGCSGSNGYVADPDDSSPAIGARKRKSFIPLYGDRAPVYERTYRSPSPQNLAYRHRSYRSPSPKRPVYVEYRSPSPNTHLYGDRIYRSPSPRPHIYDSRKYHSPSPQTPVYSDKRYRSPSPQTYVYRERNYRSPTPERRPKSPAENIPYEEYFSHPEVLLRRQLSQPSASPYFLHVYDYYQHLVQRLREQSSPNIRSNSPMSPSPPEEDLHSDAQRKRPCRALTGKHVRQGTGASLSTLLTLRQKIQERQKAKEHQPRGSLNGIGKNSVAKKSSPKKMKINNAKSAFNKVHN